MSASDQRTLAAIARHKAKHEKIRAILLEKFEVRDKRFATRREEVCTWACERLGYGWPTERFFVHEITKVAIRMGWKVSRPANRAIFVGAKRRGVPDEVEIQRSKDLRKDTLTK